MLKRHLDGKRMCDPLDDTVYIIPTIDNLIMEYHCDKCTEIFPNLPTAKNHKKSVHKEENTYVTTMYDVLSMSSNEENEEEKEEEDEEEYEEESLNSLDKKCMEYFTTEEEINFCLSFQEYLFYDNTDFIIDLKDVWKFIGYSSKDAAKHELLNTNFFRENKDYVIQTSLIKKIGEGLWKKNNKETIFLLTIDAFKLFCLITGTDQSRKIYDYYILLEKCLSEARKEEYEKLKTEHTNLKNKLSDRFLQKQLLKNYHLKPVLYLIRISEHVIKFGYTSDIQRRLSEHKRQVSDNIILVFCIETAYNIELETALKSKMNTDNAFMKLTGDKFESRIFRGEFNGNSYTELIRLDSDFTLLKLIDLIITLEDTVKQ
jgi:phage anti-repressor protein